MINFSSRFALEQRQLAQITPVVVQEIEGPHAEAVIFKDCRVCGYACAGRLDTLHLASDKIRGRTVRYRGRTLVPAGAATMQGCGCGLTAGAAISTVITAVRIVAVGLVSAPAQP